MATTTWSGTVDAKAESGVKTGFTVKKGSLLSIVASGWVSYGPSDSYPVGPQGMDGYTRDTLVYPKAWAGSLLVNIGDTLYPVGSGKLRWPAPADGELVFLINDDKGRYGDNSGEFDVTVKLESNEAGAKTWTGKVDATQPKPGQSTGITLKEGQLLSLVASGFVNLGKGYSHPVGPQGVQGDKAKGGVLIMQIGNQTFPANTGMLDWMVPTDGALSFFMQDDFYEDNTGAFDISLEVKKPA